MPQRFLLTEVKGASGNSLYLAQKVREIGENNFKVEDTLWTVLDSYDRFATLFEPKNEENS